MAVPCGRLWVLSLFVVHAPRTMHACFALRVTSKVPSRCHAGTYGKLGKLRCNLWVPGTCTRGRCSPVAHAQDALQEQMRHFVTFRAPLVCHECAHGIRGQLRCTLLVVCGCIGAPNHLRRTLTVTCNRTWGSRASVLHADEAMWAHGHAHYVLSPSGGLASAHGALDHRPSTLGVPCRRTWGIRSRVVHTQGVVWVSCVVCT